MEGKPHGSFIGLRIALLSLGVTMSVMTILSLLPMDKIGEDGTIIVHGLGEQLIPVNQVVFCVHMLVLAAAEAGSGSEMGTRLDGHILLKLQSGSIIVTIH